VWPPRIEAAEFDRLPRLLHAAINARKPHIKKEVHFCFSSHHSWFALVSFWLLFVINFLFKNVFFFLFLFFFLGWSVGCQGKKENAKGCDSCSSKG